MKIKLENIEFAYGKKQILKNISLQLDSKELLVLVGSNGAGKSTLIKCINGLLIPQNGKIILGGSNIKKMTKREIAQYIGYVPQRYDTVFGISVFDMVLLGRKPHVRWQSSQEDKMIALKSLQLLGVEDLAMRNFNEISGGQQQKVVIARALVQKTEVLLFDEPTSNLDIKHQLKVMELAKDLVDLLDISLIVSVHDLNLAARYADRIVMLKEGKVIAIGEPANVFTVENIKLVYDVDVRIKNENGRPYVVPLEQKAGTLFVSSNKKEDKYFAVAQN